MERVLLLALAATLLSGVPALAQSQGQNAADSGTAPSAQPGADTGDLGVEVSLGRTEIKQQVAQELGLPPADVPLSLHMPLEVARKVCGQEVFDSEQDSNRSCTATQYAPELAQIARDSLTTDAPSQAPGVGAEQAGGPAPESAAATYTRWSKSGGAGSQPQ